MRTMWAIVWPNGRIMADSGFRDEAEAWKIALGWPDDMEIEHAKAQGYRAVQLQVDLALLAATPFAAKNSEQEAVFKIAQCLDPADRKRWIAVGKALRGYD